MAEEELQPPVPEIDPRLLEQAKPLPAFVSLDLDPTGQVIPQTENIKILKLVPVDRSADSGPSGADLGFNETGCNEKIGYLVGTKDRNPERDNIICATKPAKRCDHLRHRSGHYYICATCRRKQSETMGDHQSAVVDKAKVRLCQSCVQKLRSVPESRRYRNQCLCASQLENR